MAAKQAGISVSQNLKSCLTMIKVNGGNFGLLVFRGRVCVIAQQTVLGSWSLLKLGWSS